MVDCPKCQEERYKWGEDDLFLQHALELHAEIEQLKVIAAQHFRAHTFSCAEVMRLRAELEAEKAVSKDLRTALGIKQTTNIRFASRNKEGDDCR